MGLEGPPGLGCLFILLLCGVLESSTWHVLVLVVHQVELHSWNMTRGKSSACLRSRCSVWSRAALPQLENVGTLGIAVPDFGSGSQPGRGLGLETRRNWRSRGKNLLFFPVRAFLDEVEAVEREDVYIGRGG